MDYPGKVITKNQVTPTQTSATGVWTLDDQAAAIKNNNWPVALVPNPISKSLRFNSADTAYLNRTFTTPTNNLKWTWSGWIKRSAAVDATIFSQGIGATNTYAHLYYSSTGELNFRQVNGSGTIVAAKTTTALYRDYSAWYHVILVYDSANATSTNRLLLYVNGVQITAFSASTDPSLNLASYINSAAAHRISSVQYSPVLYYFDGYLTEINFIDGQALTPSDFGLTNPQTGQWIPKKYTGTYGTNGFYLNFKDATSTTTLGYDYSGNANNWTTNNFSVTAGAGNDSLTDVPTPWVAYNTTGDVGGVIRGNYCTWSPLAKPAASSTSNGNLTAVTTTAADERIFSTIAVSSGKWYWEVTPTAISSGGCMVAVTSSAYEYKTANLASGDDGYGYYTTGNKYNPSTATAYGNTFTTNDVIGVALDMDNGKIYFSKNGTFQNSGDPVAGTNAAFTSISGTYTPSVSNGGTGSSCTVEANFGQRPFAYTPPTGFRSLCTTNLPATAIGFGLTNQASNYFNAVLRNGYGSSGGTLDCGFQPDFVWEKVRNSGAAFHNLLDSNRGLPKNLWSNDSGAETNATWFTGFVSNGITFGTNDYGSSSSLVDWVWKANQGVNVTNTAGTITSTVSANTTAGFSIVTYSGAGTTSSTIGHGLGVAPSMFIIKCRNNFTGATIWPVYHASVGNTAYLDLSSTNAASTLTAGWNNTSPTSTVFTVGSAAGVNGSGNTFVAYCFAAVPGYSAFGSYNSNASSDGPFIYTGFRPRFVMIKKATGSVNANAGWYMFDTARGTYNVIGPYVQANLSDAETTGSIIDTLSNGFKLRIVDISVNGSTAGDTYIYMAFAESPFQFANAR